MNYPSIYEKRILPNQFQSKEIPSNYFADEMFDRILGSFIGLAIGDALGACVEFRPHDYLVDNPVKDFQSGGTWGLEKGQWTDDTSMSCCLALSLIERKEFDCYDQMIRYKWWYERGYLSSTGNCFDIGKATLQSIQQFCQEQRKLKISFRCRNEKEIDQLQIESVKKFGQFQFYSKDFDAAGNGALMRLSSIPLFFHRYPKLAIHYAKENSRLTHGNRKSLDACRFYSALICAALQKQTKEQILHRNFCQINENWFGKDSFDEEILSIIEGSYQKSQGYDQGIRGKGFVLSSLEAALWAFWSTNDFKSGALAAVNLGDDTDTTAAIYGQLAGAFYGFRNLPSHWIEQIFAKNFLIHIAFQLYQIGKNYSPNSFEMKLIEQFSQQNQFDEEKSSENARNQREEKDQ